ncbi:SRPBCC domain-containing protein [Streptomyces sp. N50]|uniref:SRPBCC domain-containing protein n=1 Tax=Streptomyces sp. N50 TaxID=3081765 RepID=UPI0029624242|nr:SRPBCC domain-containing protein [Streptomyces sp. N50]WOX13838.1 SRPBCC domain-containing protein [Streptomyces sp. N50]
MISIAEEIAVPSPPHRVWEIVSNPSEVVACVNGAELGEAHDDGSFDGTLVVKFGAMKVSFAARVALDLTESDHEGRLSARGKDGQGGTRFTAHATFRVTEGEGPGDSRVTVQGEVQLNGRLAPLVESGAGAMVSRMTREFSAELIQRCAGAEAQAPARRAGLLGRLRAWWARLLTRSQKASVSGDFATEEAGDDPAQAQ